MGLLVPSDRAASTVAAEVNASRSLSGVIRRGGRPPRVNRPVEVGVDPTGYGAVDALHGRQVGEGVARDGP